MAPTLNGHVPDSPISINRGDSDMAMLRKRYEQFELFEQEKNKFTAVLCDLTSYLRLQLTAS
jgi:hypothetical protein